MLANETLHARLWRILLKCIFLSKGNAKVIHKSFLHKQHVYNTLLERMESNGVSPMIYLAGVLRNELGN